MSAPSLLGTRAQAIRAAWERLDPEDRRLLTWSAVDGLTLEETAREVGMSVSGVRKRLRRLRDTLARIEMT